MKNNLDVTNSSSDTTEKKKSIGVLEGTALETIQNETPKGLNTWKWTPERGEGEENFLKKIMVKIL